MAAVIDNAQLEASIQRLLPGLLAGLLEALPSAPAATPPAKGRAPSRAPSAPPDAAARIAAVLASIVSAHALPPTSSSGLSTPSSSSLGGSGAVPRPAAPRAASAAVDGVAPVQAAVARLERRLADAYATRIELEDTLGAAAKRAEVTAGEALALAGRVAADLDGSMSSARAYVESQTHDVLTTLRAHAATVRENVEAQSALLHALVSRSTAAADDRVASLEARMARFENWAHSQVLDARRTLLDSAALVAHGSPSSAGAPLPAGQRSPIASPRTPLAVMDASHTLRATPQRAPSTPRSHPESGKFSLPPPQSPAVAAPLSVDVEQVRADAVAAAVAEAREEVRSALATATLDTRARVATHAVSPAVLEERLAAASAAQQDVLASTVHELMVKLSHVAAELQSHVAATRGVADVAAEQAVQRTRGQIQAVQTEVSDLSLSLSGLTDSVGALQRRLDAEVSALSAANAMAFESQHAAHDALRTAVGEMQVKQRALVEDVLRLAASQAELAQRMSSRMDELAAPLARLHRLTSAQSKLSPSAGGAASDAEPSVPVSEPLAHQPDATLSRTNSLGRLTPVPEHAPPTPKRPETSAFPSAAGSSGSGSNGVPTPSASPRAQRDAAATTLPLAAVQPPWQPAVDAVLQEVRHVQTRLDAAIASVRADTVDALSGLERSMSVAHAEHAIALAQTRHESSAATASVTQMRHEVHATSATLGALQGELDAVTRALRVADVERAEVVESLRAADAERNALADAVDSVKRQAAHVMAAAASVAPLSPPPALPVVPDAWREHVAAVEAQVAEVRAQVSGLRALLDSRPAASAPAAASPVPAASPAPAFAAGRSERADAEMKADVLAAVAAQLAALKDGSDGALAEHDTALAELRADMQRLVHTVSQLSGTVGDVVATTVASVRAELGTQAGDIARRATADATDAAAVVATQHTQQLRDEQAAELQRVAADVQRVQCELQDVLARMACVEAASSALAAAGPTDATQREVHEALDEVRAQLAEAQASLQQVSASVPAAAEAAAAGSRALAAEALAKADAAAAAASDASTTAAAAASAAAQAAAAAMGVQAAARTQPAVEEVAHAAVAAATADALASVRDAVALLDSQHAVLSARTASLQEELADTRTEVAQAVMSARDTARHVSALAAGQAATAAEVEALSSAHAQTTQALRAAIADAVEGVARVEARAGEVGDALADARASLDAATSAAASAAQAAQASAQAVGVQCEAVANDVETAGMLARSALDAAEALQSSFGDLAQRVQAVEVQAGDTAAAHAALAAEHSASTAAVAEEVAARAREVAALSVRVSSVATEASVAAAIRASHDALASDVRRQLEARDAAHLAVHHVSAPVPKVVAAPAPAPAPRSAQPQPQPLPLPPQPLTAHGAAPVAASLPPLPHTPSVDAAVYAAHSAYETPAPPAELSIRRLSMSSEGASQHGEQAAPPHVHAPHVHAHAHAHAPHEAHADDVLPAAQTSSGSGTPAAPTIPLCPSCRQPTPTTAPGSAASTSVPASPLPANSVRSGQEGVHASNDVQAQAQAQVQASYMSTPVSVPRAAGAYHSTSGASPSVVQSEFHARMAAIQAAYAPIRTPSIGGVGVGSASLRLASPPLGRGVGMSGGAPSLGISGTLGVNGSTSGVVSPATSRPAPLLSSPGSSVAARDAASESSEVRWNEMLLRSLTATASPASPLRTASLTSPAYARPSTASPLTAPRTPAQ